MIVRTRVLASGIVLYPAMLLVLLKSPIYWPERLGPKIQREFDGSNHPTTNRSTAPVDIKS